MSGATIMNLFGGLGLFIYGMQVMGDGLQKIAGDRMRKVLEILTKTTWKGAMVGAAVTAIIQSSSATMGLVIASAAAGILNINSAIPIVLGAEIGTCITAIIASVGTSLAARRAAVAHLLFNVFGALLFLSILPYFIKFAVLTSDNIARQIANAQTGLNIICTLVALPLVGSFTKMVTVLVPGEDIVVEKGPIYLDQHLMSTPSVALGQASKEIARMERLCIEMIDFATESLFDPSKKARRRVEQREAAIDNLAGEITKYLAKISQSSMSPEQSRRLTILMHVVNDMERAGDHAEDIMQLAEEKNAERIPFSKAANEEIKQVYSDVKTMFENVLSAFETDDAKKAKEYQEIEDRIDEIARNARLGHSERLKEGVCLSQAGVLFLDLVNHYERIGDLVNSLGYATRGEITKL